MAKILIAGAFAVAGFFIAGPIGAKIGWAVGSIVGNLALPGKGQRIEGPRLNDLKVTSSAYGASIPIGYGTYKMGGNIIWSTGLKETKTTTKQSAKGAPTNTQVTYTYSASFAIMFCEGVGDVTRVWADNKLIFDITGGSTTTLKSGVTLRRYRGTEDQLPDPTIEADKGVGHVPGHRGLVYCVFSDLQLADFGNRVPNIEAEVTFSAIPNVSYTVLAPLHILVGFATNPTLQRIWVATGESGIGYGYQYGMQGGAQIGATLGSLGSQTVFGTDFDTDEDGNVYTRNSGVVKYDQSGNTIWTMAAHDALCVQYYNIGTGGKYVFAIVNFQISEFVFENRLYGINANTAHISAAVLPNSSGRFKAMAFDTNGFLWVGHTAADGDNSDFYLTAIHTADTSSVNAAYTRVDNYTVSGAVVGQAVAMWYCPADNTLVFITRTKKIVKYDLATKTLGTAVDFSAYFTDGYHYGWQKWARKGVDQFNQIWIQVPGKQVITISAVDLTVTQTFDLTKFLSTYTDLMPAGIDYAGEYDPKSGYAVISGDGYDFEGRPHRLFTLKLGALQGGPQTLDVIVSDLCQRGGLTTGQIDVTQLAGVTVHGYAIGRQFTIRDAITPLASAFFFDASESDYKVKFVPRGVATAFAIPEDDLGCGDGSTGRSQQNRKLETTLTQEAELPQAVSIVYADKGLNYENGTQTAFRYGTVNTQQTTTVEVPLVLTADEAIQIAEKALYLAWIERTQYKSTIMPKWLTLDPCDVGTITYKGNVYTVRLVSCEVGAGFSITIQGTDEDAVVYSSVATGASGDGFVTLVLSNTLETAAFLFDVPLLQDLDANDSSSGIYFAMAPSVLPGGVSWPGAVMMQSSDDVSFTQVETATVLPAYGVALNALGTPISPYSKDRLNTLTVRFQNGHVSSDTDLNVMNGTNAALLGDPSTGNWEVIQWLTATLNGDGTYTLSGLYRGRRGTEQHCSGHTAGETFIEIATDGSIGRLAIATNVKGQARYYKAVTIGTDQTSVNSSAETLQANDLKPYAPCQIMAQKNVNDWTVQWQRRTRYNGGWAAGTPTVALNETTEAYEVDIVDAGGVVKRTVTGLSSPVFTYTSAQQVADFGSNQSKIYVNVYQISASVGRGFAGYAALDGTLNILWQTPATGGVSSGGGWLINGT